MQPKANRGWFQSIGSNWAQTALQIVVLMHLTPFVLERLGAHLNSVWITIVSLTGVLRLLVLGVPMAAVRSIAAAFGRGDEQGVNRAVSTCLGVTLALGALAALIGVGQYFAFESGYLRAELGAGLSPQALDTARLAFVIAATQVAAAFALRLPYGILEAHGDFVARNAVMSGELLLRYGLTLIVLPQRPQVDTIAWILLTTMLVEFSAAWACVRRRHPRVRFSLAHFDRTQVREILSFSVFAMLLNVGALLAFRCDALVIGLALPAESTTQFDLGSKFFEPLMSLVIGIGAVVMPAATRLGASGADDELRDVFVKWSKAALAIVACIAVFLLVLGPEFLGWWAGPEYAGPSGRVLQILMASFAIYLPIRGVALPILMGLGRPARPAFALLVMGVVNVLVSIVLVGPLGLVGVALGTALPNVLFAAYVLRLACRELKEPLSRWLGAVALRPALAIALPVAVAVGWKRAIGIHSFLEFVGAGVCVSAAFAATWILLVLRNDAHFDLLAKFRARTSERGAP